VTNGDRVRSFGFFANDYAAGVFSPLDDLMTASHLLVTDDARLVLTTLGSATLRRVHPSRDADLVLEAGKPLALISHLAASPNRTGSRDHLINLLWTNLDPPEARRAVRQTLWFIKRKVGDDLLVATNDHLTLDARVESDRDLLMAAWHAGDFEDVVRLYTGDFLVDFAALGADEFEAWAEDERRRLRGIFVHAADAVARERARVGRYRDAQTLARRVRDLDPLNQAGWRLLLDCLAASGDHVAASVEADSLDRLLDTEAIEPEAATRDALRIARSAGKQDHGPTGEASPRIVVDLVGREREFAMLRQAWDNARGGRASFLHIVAPAGLGKTRLLGDLRTRLRAGKGCVVPARADQGARDVAFAFASHLAAALAECPGAIGISPQSAGSLVALNPSLSSIFNAPPDLATGEEALRRRALAVRELITTLTEEQTVALLLDDLHWSDPSSIRLFKAAVSGVERNRLLVVSASRSTPGESPAPAHAARLVLQPLADDDVASLVSSIALLPDEPWADRLPSALGAAADGSPLLLLETLQLLDERGLLVQTRSSQVGDESERFWQSPDPEALFAALTEGSAVRRRVESLDASERLLLLILATAGVLLSTSRLHAAAAPTTDDIDAPLARLERRGLVVRHEANWTTVHDEHAAAVLEGASEEESRAAARAVGRAIAADAHTDAREMRVAAPLLARGDDIPTLTRVYDALVRSTPVASGHQPDALARDLLGPAATDALVSLLVRSLPWITRARHTLARPSTVAAAALIVTLLSVAGAAAWIRARPTVKPDAVLVAERITSRGSAIELFELPIDASRWVGVGLIDVKLSGSPRWKLPPMVGFSVEVGNLRPDGNGWIFWRAVPDSGVLDIVDVNLEGRERRLTYARGDDYQPAWAPDNSAFAFITMRWADRARYDIAVHDTATRRERQLTDGDDTDWQPFWSPDGSRIAFAREFVASGDRRPCVIDSDGQHLRCQTEQAAPNLQLVGWTDPHHVVTWRPEAHQLVMVDVDSNRAVVIDSDVTGGAILSPDGKWILCTCDRRGYPPRSWLVYPLERPNEFKLVRVANPAGGAMRIGWAPTSPRSPFLDRMHIVGGVGPPILGAAYQLRASGVDSAGKTVEPGVLRWRSLDTTVAVIDSTGLLTPRRTGPVTIEASAGGWRRALKSLTVGGPVARVLFDERWTNGLSSAWRSFGEPRPEIIEDARFGRAFWSHGDEAFYSGAYTVADFTADKGLWLETILSSPITAYEWQRHVVTLFSLTDPRTDSAWKAWDHVHGDAVPGASGPTCVLAYPLGGRGTPPVEKILLGAPGGGRVIPAPNGFGTGRPFRTVLQILPDGRCGFAVDGRVLWVSAPGWVDRTVHVMLAGNSVDTKMLVGPLRVSSGIAPGIDWDARP
jgi:DNA-binding SARP family transcriptional activator